MLKASEIGFEPTPAPHHQTIKAQLFSVGLFFWEILNVYADLRRLPCDFSAIKIRYSLPFLTKITTFSVSLFSVTHVTFHKATFNKINDLRGGGLQVEIGER